MFLARCLLLFSLCLIAPVIGQTADLQTQAEIDGLRFDLLQSLQAGDHQATLLAIDGLRERDAELDPAILHFEAEAALAAGDAARAATAAEAYLATGHPDYIAATTATLNAASSLLSGGSSVVGLAGGVASTASGSASGGARRAAELALNLIISSRNRPFNREPEATFQYQQAKSAADLELRLPMGVHAAGYCSQIDGTGRFLLLPAYAGEAQGLLQEPDWQRHPQRRLYLYDRRTQRVAALSALPGGVAPCASFFWKSSLYLSHGGGNAFLKMNPETGARLSLAQASKPRGCGVGLRYLRAIPGLDRKRCSGNIEVLLENDAQGQQVLTLQDAWSKRDARFAADTVELFACDNEGRRCVFEHKGFMVSDWTHKLVAELPDVAADPASPRQLVGALSGDGQWLLHVEPAPITRLWLHRLPVLEEVRPR